MLLTKKEKEEIIKIYGNKNGKNFMPNWGIDIDFSAHEIADENCTLCWYGYPRKCICGGLIHAIFGDENSDCDYWLYKRCDRCGGEYVEV